MLNFNSIMLFSESPEKLAEFYKKIFQMEPGWSEGGYNGFMVGSASITIGPHDKVHGKNATPERIMFNLESEQVQKDFDRIKELGAEVVAEPYHPGEEPEMMLCTFADPDGNYFQIASPFKMEK